MPIDEMREVVKCKTCGRLEYFGALTWYMGTTHCRHCTHAHWQENGNWHPGTSDYVFPLYTDGVDYTKKEEKND